MVFDERLRAITIEGGRTVYINVLDIRSFQNFESQLIIEMIDGTTYRVDGAPNVNTFYTNTFLLSPVEVDVTTIPNITVDDIVNLNVDTMPVLNTTVSGSLTTFEGTVSRTPSQSVVLVSNVSVTVLASNANRKWLYFRNFSGATANPIFLHFDASAATTTNGVPIVADEIYQMPEGIIYTGEVRAISSSASNKELYIEEWS